MMKSSLNTPVAQLAGGLLIGAAVAVAFLIGGDPGSAAVSGALVVGFVLFVYVGRRHSEAVEVMSGIGDERTRSLYRDACAFAGSVMSFVLPGWWLVTVATGDPNETLALLCAIFAVTWAGAAIVLPRRS
jgi:O-antigen/teichoic acid export membrane protein